MTRSLIIGCDSSGSGGYDVSSFITEYNVEYNKLWSADSGRNMAGENRGTLVGVFTKLIVTVGQIKPNIDEMSDILLSINQPSAYVKYYDPETLGMKVESFYFGDIKTKVLSAKTRKVKLENFSIIANQRR